MPSINAIRLSWPDPSPQLLAAWIRRAAHLGILKPSAETAPAIRAALSHAAACRCAEHAEKASEPAPVAPVAPSNPLRSIREVAGLSQLEASRRLGCTRGALSTAENRASVSEKLLDRARKAYGVTR